MIIHTNRCYIVTRWHFERPDDTLYLQLNADPASPGYGSAVWVPHIADATPFSRPQALSLAAMFFAAEPEPSPWMHQVRRSMTALPAFSALRKMREATAQSA